ncbi:MAG: hypothetical protein AAF682_08885 [Planctomycetota bacterium]
MQIHRVRGRNLTDALQRARADHGEAAVVLSQEALPGGGVSIAVAEPEGAGDGRPRTAPAKRLDPGLRDVRARLARYGASKGLTERISGVIQKSGVKGMYALDVAARVIGKAFQAQPSPKRDGRTRILAFAGPSGAGKTTTMAKIGRRLVEGGRNVFFASLDGVGLGELERVSTDADRHEIPIRALASTAQLDERAAVEAGVDVVLLDTPATPLRDVERLGVLRDELSRLGRHAVAETHLVLPATASRATLDLAMRAFAPLGPKAVVLTKLDEAPHPTAALERCLRARLPVSFLCDGPDVRDGLRRARGDHFADLALRGRIAR